MRVDDELVRDEEAPEFERDRVDGVLEERVRPDEPRRLVELVRLLVRDDEAFALLFDDGALVVAFVVACELDDLLLLELVPLVVKLVPRVPT